MMTTNSSGLAQSYEEVSGLILKHGLGDVLQAFQEWLNTKEATTFDQVERERAGELSKALGKVLDHL